MRTFFSILLSDRAEALRMIARVNCECPLFAYDHVFMGKIFTNDSKADCFSLYPVFLYDEAFSLVWRFDSAQHNRTGRHFEIIRYVIVHIRGGIALPTDVARPKWKSILNDLFSLALALIAKSGGKILKRTSRARVKSFYGENKVSRTPSSNGSLVFLACFLWKKYFSGAASDCS